MYHEYLRELREVRIDKPWMCLTKAERNACKGLYEVMYRYDWGSDGDLWAMYEADSLREPIEVEKTISGPRIRVKWVFEDDQILEAVKKFLKKARPKKTRADRRGKKLNEFQAALDRIGVMRLLHHMRPSELERVDPKAFDFLKRRRNDHFKDRKKAFQLYRKLFNTKKPWMRDEPRSWETAARRSQ